MDHDEDHILGRATLGGARAGQQQQQQRQQQRGRGGAGAGSEGAGLGALAAGGGKGAAVARNWERLALSYEVVSDESDEERGGRGR